MTPYLRKRSWPIPNNQLLGLKLVVVTADGENIDMSIVELINKPVLLADPSRPEPGQVMAKFFGFSQADRRITTQHLSDDRTEVLVQSFILLAQLLVY